MLSAVSYASHPVDLMVEVGGVWQHRNDTQIPPDTGTHFEIDQFNKGPFFHYRLEGRYQVSNKSSLRLVYAPFTVKVTGRADKDVVFNGETFSKDQDLTVSYKFNSYRFSYIYALRGFGKDQINVGFTAKVRDAETRFSQPGIVSSYDNIGFVPLFYFEYQKSLGQKWDFNLTADAAAASQGRAIDATFKTRYQFSEKMNLGLGLRTLEGGADNKKVFTFSWFNYAVVDLKFTF